MSGNPNAMLVMNADDQKPLGVVMYLPNSYENDAPPQWGASGGDARANIHFAFSEQQANAPLPRRSWNYPGDPDNFKLNLH